LVANQARALASKVHCGTMPFVLPAVPVALDLSPVPLRDKLHMGKH